MQTKATVTGHHAHKNKYNTKCKQQVAIKSQLLCEKCKKINHWIDQDSFLVSGRKFVNGRDGLHVCKLVKELDHFRREAGDMSGVLVTPL